MSKYDATVNQIPNKAEPTVLKLIDENKFKREFESEPPSYLRMYYYTYHYTEAGFQVI